MTSSGLEGLSDEERRAALRRLLRSRRDTVEGWYPLSDGEKALWFLHRIAPKQTAYNVLSCSRISGMLDIAALREAVALVVQRHANLRTTFSDRLDQPIRTVHRESRVTVDLIDAAGWGDDRIMTQARLIADFPFDLTAGPLLRIAVLTRSEVEHFLTICAHHIAADFWSLELLLAEARVAYTSLRGGDRPALPHIEHTYVEFVAWQQAMVAGRAGEEHWDFWYQRLAGHLPALELPTDHTPPPTFSYAGRSHSFELCPEVQKGLRVLAADYGVTLHAVALAVFVTLLHRYTRQTDLLIGLPTSGRTHPQFHRTIGYFTNTVVLRADLTEDPQFAALLDHLQRQTAEALNHQDYPFARVVERLAPARDLSRSPIFQAAFVWHASMPTADAGLMSEDDVDELAVEQVALEHRGAPFDIMMMLADTPDRISGTIVYSTDLFDATTIARMADHFEALASGACTNPTNAISLIPVLSSEERRNVLINWQGRPVATPPTQCLHELFYNQAARTPSKPAVRYRGQSITYRELAKRSRTLASRLRTLDVGGGTRVGVCLSRTPELISALLAILETGATFIPLDPAYPRGRLQFMLADSEAPFVITEPQLKQFLPESRAQVLYVSTNNELNKDMSNESAGHPTPGDLAYIIYTSGSTGRPKGVAIEHRSAVGLVEWARREYSPQDLAAVLASTSVCFDLSIFEIFVPLAVGGTVVLVEHARDLLSHPDANYVTLINTVPSAMAELVLLSVPLPAVRVVNLAGESLPLELVRNVYAHLPNARVYNLYGPTEDTTYSTATVVQRSVSRAPSIGRPLDGKSVYILDEHLEPVPISVPGEIYIAGSGLARGYLNLPETTNERFVTNAVGERMYKTGDLARWRAEGEIEFLGRLDTQVKIRGFRIELGEVEHVFRQHEAIADVVVTATPAEGATRRLIAYVVLQPGGSIPTVIAIREFVRTQLPEFMVPAAVVFLEQLPRLPNGKVDRHRLPAPSTSRPDLDNDFVPARTDIERIIAQVWAMVLGVDQIGVHDSFFDLGGASIQSIEISMRLAREGLEVPPELLFMFPTIAELAGVLEA